MPKRLGLSEQVRRAALRSGMGVTELARKAQVHGSSMSRFLAGKRGLRLAALDRLADALDLKVAPRRKRKRDGQ